MGLDMYLYGERSLSYGKEKRISCGRQVISEKFELGYWRKHPNLHGFIVETFADQDDCEPIYLDVEELQQILDAVTSNALPETMGFFFGSSPSMDSEDPEEAEYAKEVLDQDVTFLTQAIEFLQEDDEDAYRSVYYQASW